MHHLNSLSNLKGKSDQYQVIRSQLKRKQIPVCKDIKDLQTGNLMTRQVLGKFMIILLTMTQEENSQLQEEEFLEYLRTNKNTAAHPRQTEISSKRIA